MSKIINVINVMYANASALRFYKLIYYVSVTRNHHRKPINQFYPFFALLEFEKNYLFINNKKIMKIGNCVSIALKPFLDKSVLLC